MPQIRVYNKNDYSDAVCMVWLKHIAKGYVSFEYCAIIKYIVIILKVKVLYQNIFFLNSRCLSV